MATYLPNWKPLSRQVRVKVASGEILNCTHEVQNCELVIQGQSFVLDLKILPLKCYDIILGMDWLEIHSPMTVHWAKKWMSFQYEGKRVAIQGLQPKLNELPKLSYHKVQQLEKDDEVWCILELFATQDSERNHNRPKEIDQLLHEFSKVFEKPHGLPPKRPYSHTIPLLPGSQPFRLRPYRYNPAQKDEIEKQVLELLRNGMIQESQSPFASPVLLVKKKSGEWRLCGDYRRLNAMTVKNRYPMPLLEEFLDELSGAIWFTSLDLRSGYHQLGTMNIKSCHMESLVDLQRFNT